MGKILRKHRRGAATNYITRKAALKKLQLSLKDFRRLCILKGIHPHEPRHKKKVNRGSTDIKTWYYAKDILFLQHEPIINKFREYKIFLRKVAKYKNKKDDEKLGRLFDNKPSYQLDHVVKERYPTFVDAVRDLDDALCLCFLFGRLPKGSKLPADRAALCRRLTVEFMLYVIAAKALRKVFVSIKGTYYQADIVGQTVTWIVPHDRGFPLVTEVDFQVMSTFVEFYTTALGFVNFRLFRSLGLRYPPQIERDSKTDDGELYVDDSEARYERLYALSETLKTASASVNVEELTVDEFQTAESDSVTADLTKKRERIRNLQNLFSKCKFFLSREVPRESLTFVIRSCGGQASWDPSTAYGSVYEESDQTITHQIVDRPSVEKLHLSRRYVQPQWVFDCLNAGVLLPVEDYFPGSVLPPHLSPFVEESESDYVPPEKIQLLQLQGEDVSKWRTTENVEVPADVSSNSVDVSAKEKVPRKAKAEKPPATMKVESGRMEKIHAQKLSSDASENKKLREMMIPKKHKRVYQKIKKKQKHVNREAENLKLKRQNYDRNRSVKNIVDVA